MTLHPEDVRYWTGWAIAFVVWLGCTRLFLVNPVLRAIARLTRILRAVARLAR